MALKIITILCLLAFNFSCANNKYRKPGYVVLRVKDFEPVSCKEKVSPKILNDFKMYYGDITQEAEAKIFSSLDCDQSKLFRFIKVTKYLASIAEITKIEARSDFLKYYIPKICLGKINYEDHMPLANQFEKEFSTKSLGSFSNCENKKYQQVINILIKSKRF